MDGELIVMRLAEMHRVHTKQDNSRVCSYCGHKVGIYPSGQQVLKQHPTMKLRCNQCYTGDDIYQREVLAPGALNEPFESVDKT